MEPHKDHIVFSKRQVSMMMASIVIFCLFIFIVGFFLGKRAMTEEFSSNVTQNALHDQIDYLLTSQSLKSSQEDNVSDESLENNNVLEADLKQVDTVVPVTQEIVVEPVQEIKISHVKTAEEKEEKIDEQKTAQENVHRPQYACLIGFGTKQAANAFVARLKKHHVPVILKTNISKSTSGKVRTWYQAITPTYNTAVELQDIIQKVKRLEHIRDTDIKIVYVK